MTTQRMIHHYSCHRLFLMALSIIFLMAAGGIMGCSSSSGDSTEYHLTGYDGVPKADAAAATAGLLDAGNSGLTFYAQAPWYVNITLQVTDQDGHGVTDLSAADFNVYENDVLLDTLKSNINLRKRSALPPGFSYRLKTVLLIDNSSSVPLEILKDMLDGAWAVVENMDARKQQEIALVAFDNDGAPMLISDFTSNATQLKPYLFIEDEDSDGGNINNEDILAILDGISDSTTGPSRIITRSLGAADLYGAVKYALSLWDEDPSPMMDEDQTSKTLTQGIVVAITQGRDTAGLYDVNEAIADRDRNNKRIITVPVGSGISADILAEMEQLGNSGYYPVPKTVKDEVIVQMTAVQERMISIADAFYWIQYKSEQSGAAGARRDHTLEVRLAENQNTQETAIIQGTFSSKDFITGNMGVYFNATAANPSGIKDNELIITVERGQAAGSVTQDISALTYSRASKAPSQFTWTLPSATDVIKVAPKSGSGGTNVVITAYKPGDTTIRVKDTANDISADLNVKVVVREFSYEIFKYTVESASPWYADATFQVRETNPTSNQWKWVTDMKREEFTLFEDKGTALQNQVDLETSEVNLRKRNRLPSDYSYVLNTVLLIDNSPSTDADGDYLELIKEAAKAFVHRALEDDPEDVNYNKGPILDASGNIQQRIAIMSFTEMGDVSLVENFSTSEAGLNAAIDSIPQGFGPISFYDGILQSLRLWQNNQAPRSGDQELRQGIVVALTDGWDSAPGFVNKDAVLDEINDKQVICVGVADDLVTEANIKDLQAFGNAGYYSVPNAQAELPQTLRLIQDEIVDFADSFYWLNYKSYADVAGNCANTTKLDISIINNSNPVQKSISGAFETCEFFDGIAGMVYINSTATDPWGKDEFVMQYADTGGAIIFANGTLTLNALTYHPDNAPDYKWTTTNPAILSVKMDTTTYANSKAIVSLPSNPRAGTAQIRVQDEGNNTQKLITVHVERVPIPMPFAYYPFKGNANNAVGSGFNGTPFGPKLVPDRLGNPSSAYSFNGTTDYIALDMYYGPDNGSPSWAGDSLPEVSVGAWVRSSSQKGQFVAAFDGTEYWAFALKYPSVNQTQYLMEGTWMDDKVGWLLTNTSGTSYGLNSIKEYTDGRWHFIMATYDSNNSKIYVDGQEVASIHANGPIGRGQPSWGFIGVGAAARWFDGNKFLAGTYWGDTVFEGIIDEVLIFHHALTPDQISAIYQRNY